MEKQKEVKRERERESELKKWLIMLQEMMSIWLNFVFFYSFVPLYSFFILINEYKDTYILLIVVVFKIINTHIHM